MKLYKITKDVPVPPKDGGGLIFAKGNIVLSLNGNLRNLSRKAHFCGWDSLIVEYPNLYQEIAFTEDIKKLEGYSAIIDQIRDNIANENVEISKLQLKIKSHEKNKEFYIKTLELLE